MARIPLVSAQTMTAEQKQAYDQILARNHRIGRLPGPYWMLLHSPELADNCSQVGELLRYRTELEPRLSELAILVTARVCDSQYEWYAHAPMARNSGVSEEVIEAIRQGQRPEFERADEAALYDYVSELHRDHRVSDATYDCALGQFGRKGLVELTMLTGYYVMVAFTLAAHEYDKHGIPAGTPLPLSPLR